MRGSVHWSFGAPPVRACVEAWLQAGDGAIPLAEGAGRRLLRLPVENAPDLLVKLFRVATGPHPWRERIKRRLGASPAQREWRALRRLHAAGLAVPAPLGRARLASGDEIVVEEFIPGPSPNALLGEPTPERRALLLALAAAVSRLHAAGFAHGDLHPGNLIAGPDGPVLLDFQRARRARPGSRRQLRDLALLDSSLARLGVSLTDRLRVARGALDRAGTGPRPTRRALREVGRESERAAARHRRNRTRHCTRAGAHRAEFHCEGGTGLRLRSLPAASLRSLLQEHRAALSARDARVVEDDGRIRITSLEAAGRRVVVKEVHQTRLLRRWADLWRGSPGRRAWRGGHGLALRGIAAAAPLAFLEHRRQGLPARSWVVLESIGESSLADASRYADLPPGALAEALCELLVSLHRMGVSHGDLKASNIRFTRRGDRLRPALVDLDGVRFPRRLSPGRRILELAQLNASLAETVLPADEREAALRRYERRLPFPAGHEAAREQIIRQSLAREHVWRGSDCRAGGP